MDSELLGAGSPAHSRLELVDAHHHLIDLEAVDYPWIRRRNPALEALLDNYYEIAHDYDIDDYRSDVANERLMKSVACEFGAADPVAEAVCGSVPYSNHHAAW